MGAAGPRRPRSTPRPRPPDQPGTATRRNRGIGSASDGCRCWSMRPCRSAAAAATNMAQVHEPRLQAVGYSAVAVMTASPSLAQATIPPSMLIASRPCAARTCRLQPAWSAHRTARRSSRRASSPAYARRRCRSIGRCTSAVRPRPRVRRWARRCTRRRTPPAAGITPTGVCWL